MNTESVFIGCRTREDTRTKGLRQASERVMGLMVVGLRIAEKWKT